MFFFNIYDLDNEFYEKEEGQCMVVESLIYRELYHLYVPWL